MGISSVAVYSTADAESLHVRFADEAVCIGPPSSADSYLKISNIIAAAEITNADAIHPGYGFLSENAKFSKICDEHEIKFIGASAEMINRMGDKANAKETMIPTAEEIADEIRMLSNFKSGPFILVEGDSDVKFFLNHMILDIENIFPSYGWEKLFATMSILQSNGFGNVLGIIDLDYRGIVATSSIPQNILNPPITAVNPC